MQVTLLTDNRQIGKVPTGNSQIPSTGIIETKTFHSISEFGSIIENMTMHQALTVGLFPDSYHYVPANNTEDLMRPNYITRQAQYASPGHILCIDCDQPKFAHLKGQHLHEFLARYLPDFFAGAGYVSTYSSSYYLKGQQKFHQYYFFEKPADMKPLMLLIDKLFKHHNMLTYQIASNYSRVFIKTPIDTKLNELQMPIFEMSKQRLEALGISSPSLDIQIQEGNIIQISPLTLPSPDLSKLQENHNRLLEEGEADRKIKLEKYVQEHGMPVSRSSDLEKQHLPASFEIVAYDNSGKVKYQTTTIKKQVLELITNSKNPHELYQAIGEPEYSQSQTAKLFFDNPFDLRTYKMIDQAHGGIHYLIIWDYDDVLDIFTAAEDHGISKRNFMLLTGLYNTLTSKEANLISRDFSKKIGSTPKEIQKWLTEGTDPAALYSMDDIELKPSVLHTLQAAIEKNIGKINMPKGLKEALNDGTVDPNTIFDSGNALIIEDITHDFGGKIAVKPGPLNNFNIAPKSQIVKDLAPLYPLTNISPAADEITMDALLDKFASTKHIEHVTYKASLHGEKLNFSDNKMEIIYQQPKPSFINVPESTKMTLDSLSHHQEMELREIYMKESIGGMWDYIAELVYIKKIYPELKKDFLWLHFPSDAGKTFNMDASNIITPYTKTNLDQLNEQAAKVKPSQVAKSSFLFHDEVKHFKHAWNEMGNMYPIKGMHSDQILTQLPLKLLASAENTLSKGTKQQLNRLMVYRSDAKPFTEIVDSSQWANMTAITYQVIYEKMMESYTKYSKLPQNEALQLAITTASSLAISLAPSDMMVTEDVIKEAIVSYLLQEYVVYDDLCNSINTHPDDGLSRFIKKVAISKKGDLCVNFKKVDAPAFIEYVLRITTSSLESRAMNYEALSVTWEDLGAKKVGMKTIGGVSGFYGNILEIEIPALNERI